MNYVSQEELNIIVYSQQDFNNKISKKRNSIAIVIFFRCMFAFKLNLISSREDFKKYLLNMNGIYQPE